MEKVISRDGTFIAFDKLGQGSEIILVNGGFGTRVHTRRLAELLAPHFTVINYDRRGRGDSGDAPVYAVEREIEDLEALVNETGGATNLYGISSGAILALLVASELSGKITGLALYEPPFILDNSRPPLPEDYVEQLKEAIAAGDRGKAVEICLAHALLLPRGFIEQLQNSPDWTEMERVAHTLVYDGIIQLEFMLGKPLPPAFGERIGRITIPALVLDGERSPTFFHTAARTLARLLPDARHLTLSGQEHGVDPLALAPVLVEFFSF